MMEIKNKKQLALELCRREGKKKQVNIFQATETLARLADIEKEQPGVLRLLGADHQHRRLLLTGLLGIEVIGNGIAMMAKTAMLHLALPREERDYRKTIRTSVKIAAKKMVKRKTKKRK